MQTSRQIVGREEELRSIAAFLDRARDGPGVLVLSGEAGIGKTILWEHVVEEARQRVGRVLLHRSAEAEASLSFTGLSDLLTPVFDQVAPSLAPLRRRALEVALLLAEPGESALDPRAIGLALLDVLRALAEHGPVVVALDDVQWLDPSSAGVLQMALRRLGNEPVGVLATLRKAPDTTAPVDFERSFPEERLTRLSLGPLSLGALHRLLEKRIGLELTRPETVRVHEASGGNPFFALELGRELARTGERPAAGETLPVPDSLRELLGGRLGRLPTETGDVVLLTAALARPTIELVASAHGDRDGVLEALDTAAREGVVELDGSRVRFAHPLLASICYEQAPPWKRQAVHRALAATVADLEERARHLALAADGPNDAIAAELDEASERAAGRGAPTAAADLSELAAELSNDPADARARRLQAARLHGLAGDDARAVVLLDRLLGEVPAGTERADILLARLWTFSGDTPALEALSEEALEAAAGDDVRSARILALLAWVHLMKADVTASLAAARAALEKAERADDRALLAAVIARLAQAESWAAEVTPGLLERGVEIEERLGLVLDFRESPSLYLPRLLMRQGEIERPRALLEGLEARATVRGHDATRATILWYLSLLEWMVGRLQRALDHASAAQEHGGGVHTGWTGRVKALVEVDIGLVAAARASADVGIEHSRAHSNDVFTLVNLGVLGRLELALGDLDAAAGYLGELPERMLAAGLNDPTLTVWADAIETLGAVGELEQARSYLERYDVNARRLGSPWALAAAARCRGLLAAAEGDTPAAFASIERALAVLDAHPYPLERGRTLLCLGVVRRQAQQKKAAREALEQALAIFEQLGARLWADKTRAELARISGRRAPSDELTETEALVAALAAAGRSNKEIATELYMGVSTVEAHLSRVYRKLGLRSRTELAGRAVREGDPAKARDETIQT